MAKIIKMPLRQPETDRDNCLSEREAVTLIQDLVWDNPTAFFTLEAECLASAPIGMPPEIQQILRQYKLLNDKNRPPEIVRNLMRILARNMSESLAREAACR